MSESEVTREGLRGARPDREAPTGVNVPGKRRRKRGRRGEQLMVPDAEFTSYYGKPIINPPVWSVPDIPGYLFLGGLAGLSSVLAAGADLTGRPVLAKAAKLAAVGGGALSVVALVHDLGRPMRFLNMLRVFKVTSPMSVGSWLLSGYVPVAGVAAASAVTGRMPRIGALATAGAATLGPAVAAYTAVLLSDTAVPAWHEGYQEMPFVFVGSGASAAGGLGLLAAPLTEAGPARNLAVFGAGTELLALRRMRQHIGMVAEAYDTGKAAKYLKASEVLSVLGAVGAVLGRRSRTVGALSGAALLAASAATRWGIFHAGMISSEDPKYTVVPQRQRLRERAGQHTAGQV
jgi:formate-dependent nitrite reductase membrane component NrfD